jgi:hypothetical protein
MLITLKCQNCGIKFERDQAKQNHNISVGQLNAYCSRECSVEGNRKNRTGFRSNKIYLGKYGNKRKDL